MQEVFILYPPPSLVAVYLHTGCHPMKYDTTGERTLDTAALIKPHSLN